MEKIKYYKGTDLKDYNKKVAPAPKKQTVKANMGAMTSQVGGKRK